MKLCWVDSTLFRLAGTLGHLFRFSNSFEVMIKRASKIAAARSSYMPYPQCDIPALALVRQKFSANHIANVSSEVCKRLLDSGLGKKITNGDRVAITAGSRGMGRFLELLTGVVEAVKCAGGKPFIIPAMGSHGGATAEGQCRLLELLGISERSVKAPIHSSMKTIEVGTSKNGAIAHLDEFAAKAEGIIVLGRVQKHPENKAGVASGLLKMVTVGLGKQSGAQQAHSHGLWDSVKAVPRHTMSRAKILFGVAVVENAYRQPVLVDVVPPYYAAFRDADEKLLKLSLPHSAKLPFGKLDVLIVDELGKNISGTGMDLNVIGKWRVAGGERKPDFFRIVALSLTKGSMGNGLGIGLADFTTRRFLDEFDPAATYINLLTASEPGAMNTREGQFPLALQSDRAAIGVALYSALPNSTPRVCRVKSTAQLDELWVSAALLPEVKRNPKLEVISPAEPMPFNRNGNLF